ncbi:PLP-dependent transferase [Xylona heveae TC161]|uniref:PLP-dependent transferase n=1 Tax=Xylona heveae (strain CBS 132557 / TC161) TaxID=1328760 RepID=A0A164ZUN5_XYLHT|nr:PLP-dependent transferase [Xylona heveae TC161]KZF19551.1 PLP-dependent transferase [Xylona heveae TC161]
MTEHLVPCAANMASYNAEEIREREYPQLQGRIYLDHAGTTLYAKSLIETHCRDLVDNLYGNPHSDNSPSKLSGQLVEDIRDKALRFFGASSTDFDLVFVANSTAGMKLVGESIASYSQRTLSSAPLNPLGSGANNGFGFQYFYHQDSHTSLVGLRELALSGSTCLRNDHDVTQWIRNFQAENSGAQVGPIVLPDDIRALKCRSQIYTLWDAAALATTSSIDLSSSATAPDFTVVSFYKIFGYPDLGGLIIRKAATHMFQYRRYFGGGTVDMVTNYPSAQDAPWYANRTGPPHEYLEDGTLPFHNIFALSHAIDKHMELFNSMHCISSHTSNLIHETYRALRNLKHANSTPLCQILYNSNLGHFGDSRTQGPTIAFSVLSPSGRPYGYVDVERAADRAGIYVRSGSVCNPGGMVYLGWEQMEDMQRAWNAGHRCSNPVQEIDGMPTGIIRVSLGAMSTIADVNGFVKWLKETYLDHSLDVEMDTGLNVHKVHQKTLLIRQASATKHHFIGPSNAITGKVNPIKKGKGHDQNHGERKSKFLVSRVRRAWHFCLGP